MKYQENYIKKVTLLNWRAVASATAKLPCVSKVRMGRETIKGDKMVTEENKKVIEDFESMINFAELKALSKYSLETPLTDGQYKRMMELKEKVFK